MAGVSASQIWQGRDGEFSLDEKRYSMVHRVVMDSSSDDAATVRSFLYTATGIRIGAAFPSDSAAFCQSIKPRNESYSPRIWLVTSLFSDKFDRAENPLNDPVRVRWVGRTFSRPLIYDANGDAIVNSAGDPFDPPPERDFSRRVAQISANVAAVPSYLDTYEDAINSDSVTLDGKSFAAGTLKCGQLQISEWKERNSTAYREISLEIETSREGWNLELLDAGFRERDYSGNLVNIRNTGDNELPTAPVPLDGSGNVLADPTPANAVVLTFQQYPSLAFAGNLPGCS